MPRSGHSTFYPLCNSLQGKLIRPIGWPILGLIGAPVTDRTAGKVVVCRIGARRFALPVAAVREVCTGFSLVRVPGVAAPVEGVANVRGTLVTVIRGAELFDLAGDGPGSNWLVVLGIRSGRIGIGVDEVLDLDTGMTGIDLVDIEAVLGSVFDRLR